jgi:hypothetical protein
MWMHGADMPRLVLYRAHSLCIHVHRSCMRSQCIPTYTHKYIHTYIHALCVYTHCVQQIQYIHAAPSPHVNHVMYTLSVCTMHFYRSQCIHVYMQHLALMSIMSWFLNLCKMCFDIICSHNIGCICSRRKRTRMVSAGAWGQTTGCYGKMFGMSLGCA